MSQFYFRYGAMNASKSIQLLTVAHNYETSGKRVMLFAPSVDNRFGVGKITSRVGLSRDAISIDENTDIFEIVKNQREPVHAVLIDEAQFSTKHHVTQMRRIVDELNIPVIAYGLLKDFKNELFEGSYHLLCEAQKFEEIKTVCRHCNKKATHILKYKDGKPIYEGETIEIGDEAYESVCRKHYYSPPQK